MKPTHTRNTLFWFTVQVVGLLATRQVNVKARADADAKTIKGMARVKAPGGLAYNIIGQEEAQ